MNDEWLAHLKRAALKGGRATAKKGKEFYAEIGRKPKKKRKKSK